MNKSDMLQPVIEKFLFDINFIERYRQISSDFDNKDESFKFTNASVLALLEDHGINAKIHEGDQYFPDFEMIKDFQVRLGLTIKYNMIDFDITIRNEAQQINSGGSWGQIVQLMTNWQDNIKKPGFSGIDELTGLVAAGISLYAAIKEGLAQLKKEP